MIKQRIKSILVSASAAMLLASCVAGIGSVATGGIGGTGISWGTITAFGSVYVNGVHFNTDNVETVRVNGTDYTDLSQLHVGMVVRVYGSINADGVNGTATGIVYENELSGPIYSVNTVQNSLTVMGQTIYVDGDTLYSNSYDSTPIASLQDLDPLVGTRYEIELSGYAGSNNTVYASRIEVKDVWSSDTGEVEIKGNISEVLGNTLKLAGLSVDIGSLSELDFTPAIGQYVKAKGSYSVSANTLTASSLELKELEVSGSEGDEFEIEGVITQEPNGSNIMLVNGQQVDITSAEFDKGDVDMLTLGNHVRVEGVFDASGEVLTQVSIEFRSLGSETEDQGYITVNTAKNSVTLNSDEIVINNSTILRDDRDIATDENLNFTELAQLASGTLYAEIRYYNDGSTNIATRLTLKDLP
jgi:hypothetical protein